MRECPPRDSYMAGGMSCPMMTEQLITDTGCATARTIDRILEISAEAQIQRCGVAQDSAAYLALTNEITACAIALQFLCHQQTPEWQPGLTRRAELQLSR